VSNRDPACSLGGGGQIADSPAGDRKGLRQPSQRHTTRAHLRQFLERHVKLPVENDVLVDLVTESDQIVALAKIGE
jgi:hypothetical protein